MIKVVEIFDSFQGEGLYTGYPMTFVRIAGCPVECPFCDTNYKTGNLELPDVLSYPLRSRVCVTGGEPLAHPHISLLLEGIWGCQGVRYIHIETSGCYPIPDIVQESHSTFWLTVSPKGGFLDAKKDFIPGVLKLADEVKWVVPSTPRSIIDMHRGCCKRNYLQPENDQFNINLSNLSYAEKLAEELDWPLSLQVHKLVSWR